MSDELTAASAAPPDMLGAPPVLIPGENNDAYRSFLASIRAVLQPADVLEEIWLRDVADLAWEILRLRRLKAHLLRTGVHDGMVKLLRPLIEYPDFAVRDWARGEHRGEVDNALSRAKFTTESVMAGALSVQIQDMERIERMTAAAEARRDGILREIERRRAHTASELRRAMEAVEEAEFKEIEKAAPEAA